MFCTKCGNELPEGTNFCPKCGAPQNGAVEVTSKKEKVEDNQIKFIVKPTIKPLLLMLSPILVSIFVLVMFGLIGISTGTIETIFFAIGFDVVIMLFAFIAYLFRRKQLQKMEYHFYGTKLVYRDSFLNLAEKEIKYKYIREVIHTQPVLSRIFGLGNIILYTNAETGLGSGIAIPYVKNSKEVYEKVKEIINY